MEFILKEDIPYFTECEVLITGMGFKLVNLDIFNKNGTVHVKAVIKALSGVGIKDCASVHRALQPRLEVLLNTQDITVEVSSPGINRTVKSTVEFFAFIGEKVEVWDNTVTDWRCGILKSVSSSGLCLVIDGAEIVLPYEAIKKARCNL